jgi:hypothetical protein
MSGFAAEDAGKRAFDASKAISAGLLAASQTEWKELLVCPVERGGQAEV